MVLKAFRGARRLLNTIRIDLDTAGAGLTFPNNEITQYSCFGECQCTRIDPQNLPFCPGPPQNTFIIYSSIFQNDNYLNCVSRIWNFEHLKIFDSENLKLCFLGEICSWKRCLYQNQQRVNVSDVQLCRFSDFLTVKSQKQFKEWSFWNVGKQIKVFCEALGQKGSIWKQILIHWHSQKHEYWVISLFGEVNPAPVVSKCVR